MHELALATGHPIDPVLYSSLLAVNAFVGRLEDALKVFSEMKQSGIEIQGEAFLWLLQVG